MPAVGRVAVPPSAAVVHATVPPRTVPPNRDNDSVQHYFGSNKLAQHHPTLFDACWIHLNILG